MAKLNDLLNGGSVGSSSSNKNQDEAKVEETKVSTGNESDSETEKEGITEESTNETKEVVDETQESEAVEDKEVSDSEGSQEGEKVEEPEQVPEEPEQVPEEPRKEYYGVPLSDRVSINGGFVSLPTFFKTEIKEGTAHSIAALLLENFSGSYKTTNDFEIVKDGVCMEIKCDSGRTYNVATDSTIIAYKDGSFGPEKAIDIEVGNHILVRARALVPTKMDIGAFNAVLAKSKDINFDQSSMFNRIPIQRVAAIVGYMQKVPFGAKCEDEKFINMMSDMMFSIGVLNRKEKVDGGWLLRVPAQARKVFNDYLNFVNEHFDGTNNTQSADIRLMSTVKEIPYQSYVDRDNIGKVNYSLVADRVNSVSQFKTILMNPVLKEKGFMVGSLYVE